MKLIVSLLVLCLVFSTGAALAKTDKTGSMDQSMGTNMDKMTSSTDKAIVLFAGNVTGNVTYSVNEMNGMAGNMSAGGKTKTRNINGNLLVIKDIEKNTENIVLIGKMDGMKKPVTIMGKLDHMNKMSGNTDGMDGYLDNEKVIITGDITCDMAGKVVIIGKMNDMQEMASDIKGKTGMAGYEAETAGSMNEDNMADDMDKNVTVNAVIRSNIAGKLVIIGKMSDIKGMIGKEETTGMDGYKTGVAGYFDEEMKGMATGKAGAVTYSNDNVKGMAAGKAGVVGVSTDNMKGMAAGKAGAVAYSNENGTGIVAGKAGMLAYKNADITVLMAGVVKCKMTGINMVVLGNMDKITGAQAGMAEEECGMMAGTTQSEMSNNQGQMCGNEQTKTGMVGEKSGMMTENMKSGMMTENMKSSTTTKGC